MLDFTSDTPRLEHELAEAHGGRSALALLQRLAEDDGVRSRLECNPVEALAEYGFGIDPAVAPQAARQSSKAYLHEHAEALCRQVQATSGRIVFMR